MIKAPIGKTVGEMSAEELDAACHAATGLRPPRDPAQRPAYLVAMAIASAAKVLTDRDLIERYVIDFFLGRGEPQPEYRALIEKAFGRPIGADEPRPFDIESLFQEQAQRIRWEAAVLLD
jgi:hypothetical protein